VISQVKSQTTFLYLSLKSGYVSYQISKPSLLLAPFVKQYWAIENCLPAGSTHVQRIVPSGLMDLMFYTGGKPKIADESRDLSGCSVVSGQQTGFFDIVITGKMALFSITFKPFGAKMFFNLPSNEFLNQYVPLQYFIKEPVNQVENDLYEATTFTEKVRVAERFLFNLLKRNQSEYDLRRVMHSIEVINQNNGIVNIGALASEACLSRKQFERTFSAFIGASPKQFLKTLRFQNSLHQKQRNKNIHLTSLAHTCGYFDQSHMIGDYKTMSGKTPSQYFAECEPFSDYFNS
jgi:AraC-like DNA-binding protein